MSAAVSSTKRALVVGIGQYDPASGYRSLKHATSDAERFAKVLGHHHDGKPNWDLRLLHDGAGAPIGRRDLTEELRAFLASTGTTDDAHLLFYFSGHADEEYGLLAYSGEGQTFADLWDKVEKASRRASSVTVILDCCTSGGLSTAPEGLLPHKQLELRNVSILTACRPEEFAFEHPVHGSPFTAHLIGGLMGAAADIEGAVTPMSLYAYASRAFGPSDQRPTFKALAVAPTLLRRASPRVPAESLALLAKIFGSNDQPRRVVLTRNHEGVSGDEGFIPRDLSGRAPFTGSDKQVELDHLKVYRDAHLLKADDGRDFYFLCLEPDESMATVSLTEVGLYYWGLAKRGMLNVEAN